DSGLRRQTPSGSRRTDRGNGRYARRADANDVSIFTPPASFPSASGLCRLARKTAEAGTAIRGGAALTNRAWVREPLFSLCMATSPAWKFCFGPVKVPRQSYGENR